MMINIHQFFDFQFSFLCNFILNYFYFINILSIYLDNQFMNASRNMDRTKQAFDLDSEVS